MAYYNITQVTSLNEIFSYVNSYVPFGIGLLLVTFFVSFFYMKRYENVVALVPSVFLTFLTSLVLFFLGLVADYVEYALLVLVGILAMLLKVRR